MSTVFLIISVIFLKILSKRESDKYQILSCKNIASNSLLRKAPMPLDSHAHCAYNIDGGGEMRFIELERLIKKNGWYLKESLIKQTLRLV